MANRSMRQRAGGGNGRNGNGNGRNGTGRNGTSARNHTHKRIDIHGDERARDLPQSFDPRERKRPLIAVFGSSRPRRGDELFTQGLELGRALGAAEFDVMTGGYTGVMEAVSQGAHEAGAHVLGITMKGFEDRANPFVMSEVYTPNFYVRFRWLVDRADGWVAMRGGMGTLAEMTFAWQKLSLRMFAERPLVLLGVEWRNVLEAWLGNLTVLTDDYRGLSVAETPDQVCQVLRAFFAREESNRPGLDHRW
jgi:uncharacterized protein (TIGR00730 family)